MLFCSFVSSGCDDATSVGRRASTGALRLAVTTSTQDSGIIDALVPIFENEHGVRVDVIALGTGKALKLGETGDVDVVFVHSRTDEDAFMAAGHGIRREDVMYNHFELLGPASDPAGVFGTDIVEGLRRISSGGHTFISRGDDSGTHKRELALWQLAGGHAPWDGYLETGQGMGSSLIIADQKQGYILSDRGTYLRFKQKIDLVALARSSEGLRNPYGIIVVNPQTNPTPHSEMANTFVDFIISAQVQRLIDDFRIDGERLFYPLRLP